MSDSDPDLLDSIIKRGKAKVSDRLERQMEEAGELKAAEEAGSQQRLEAMWMREYERQRAIAEAQAEQQRQEQRLVRYVLAGVAIAILAILILSFILSQPAAAPAPESLLLSLANV